VPPYHVFFFVRLQKLLKNAAGGVFTDFSWVHLRPLLVNIHTGYSIHTTCYVNSSDEETSISRPVRMFPVSSLDSPRSSITSVDKPRHCHTSTLMAFRQRDGDAVTHRNLLICMLKKYEGGTLSSSKSGLVECVKAEGEETGGALCIQRAIEDCFTEHSVANQLKSIRGDEKYSTVGNFYWESNLARNFWLQDVGNSISSNDIRSSTLGMYASSLSHYNDGTVIPTSILWMGCDLGCGLLPEDANTDWIVPSKETMIGHFALIMQGRLIKGIRAYSNLSKDSSGGPVCHPYYESSPRGYHPLSAPGMGRASLSCSISFVMPGFMKSASSFLYESLIRHPLVLHALRGVRFKETGCYLPQRVNQEPPVHPQSRLDCFPFVEKNEAQYKFGDATVYYASGVRTPAMFLRDNPDIKAIFVVRNPITRLLSHYKFSIGECKKEGLMTASEAVHWALRPDNHLVHNLRNAAVKAVDALHMSQMGLNDSVVGNTFLSSIMCNHPIHVYLSTSDCKDSSILDKGISRNPIESVVDAYHNGFNPQNRKDRLSLTMIQNSLYFPAIVHWMKQLGRHNVLVVPTESLHLSSKNPSGGSRKQIRLAVGSVLNSVYRFIGVHDYDGVLHAELHKTEDLIGKLPLRKDVIELNDSAAALAHDFFYPFNKLLRVLVSLTNTSVVDISY